MGNLTQQLVEQIQHAHATKTALNIQAGNTKASLGRHTSGQVIDVSQHTGVLSYNPTELVITARAGTKIEHLNDLLAQTQQRLPFEPPAFAGEATIGGTVAANQSGPSRPWFGSVKDSLLGLGLINGYGQAMQFGGQVMKNVAGFDVTRLQCGAMGGLGLITQVSIKLLPAFKLTQTLTFEMTAQAALDTMQHWSNLSLPITGMCHFQNKGQSLLYVRLQGGISGVEDAQVFLGGESLLPAKADAFWQALNQGTLMQRQDHQTLWCWGGPSDAPFNSVPNTCMINWAGAQRWVLEDTSNTRSQGLEKSLCQYQGGNRLGEVNGTVSVPQKALQQRIKHAFDPHSILNAGRVYSWM